MQTKKKESQDANTLRDEFFKDKNTVFYLIELIEICT